MSRRPRGDDRAGTPLLLVPPAILGASLLVVPAIALVVRAPWSNLGPIYTQYRFWDALRISVETSQEVTAISFVLGTPLAWVLARRRFVGKSLLRAAVTLPLVLPPVVGGIALFFALGRNGLVGQYLYDWFGWSLPFTQFGIVIAGTFVSMPFLFNDFDHVKRVLYGPPGAKAKGMAKDTMRVQILSRLSSDSSVFLSKQPIHPAHHARDITLPVPHIRPWVQ